jgi:hypothetical protein
MYFFHETFRGVRTSHRTARAHNIFMINRYIFRYILFEYIFLYKDSTVFSSNSLTVETHITFDVNQAFPFCTNDYSSKMS